MIADALLNALWSDVEKDKTLRVFSLQDAAADPRIHPNLVLSMMDSACLYEGRLPRVLEQAAPHIVRLAAAATYTRWFLEAGWGHHWGVLLQSRANLPDSRAHFRRLLLVKNEAGSRFTFRFYDPRVLRAYLPTCTPGELHQFFGPAERFFCPSENGQELLAYDLAGGALRIKRVPVAASPSAAYQPQAKEKAART